MSSADEVAETTTASVCYEPSNNENVARISLLINDTRNDESNDENEDPQQEAKVKKSRPTRDQFLSFAAYPNRPYRLKGVHCDSLKDILDHSDAKSSLLKQLAARMMPHDCELRGKSRCNVYFLKRQAGEKLSLEKKALYSQVFNFYSSILKESLAVEINDGDEDSEYTMEHVIDSVLKDDRTSNIFITIWKKKEQDDKSDGKAEYSEEILAAISFSGKNVEAFDSLMIGLCGVSDQRYKKKVYGQNGDNGPWRNRGLMRLLLKLCCKLHRSTYRREGNLSVYACLRSNYTKTVSFFRAMKFYPVAGNFKDCFGVQLRKGFPGFVPFLAEGMVFEYIGTLLNIARLTLQ
jgi:hypothetical protein